MTYPDRVGLENPNHFSRYRASFGSLLAHDSEGPPDRVPGYTPVKNANSVRPQARGKCMKASKLVVNCNSHRCAEVAALGCRRSRQSWAPEDASGFGKMGAPDCRLECTYLTPSWPRARGPTAHCDSSHTSCSDTRHILAIGKLEESTIRKLLEGGFRVVSTK